MITMTLAILIFIYSVVESLNSVFGLLVTLVELQGSDLTQTKIISIVDKLKNRTWRLTCNAIILGIILASIYTTIIGIHAGNLKAVVSKWGVVSYTNVAADTIELKGESKK